MCGKIMLCKKENFLNMCGGYLCVNNKVNEVVNMQKKTERNFNVYI